MGWELPNPFFKLKIERNRLISAVTKGMVLFNSFTYSFVSSKDMLIFPILKVIYI